MPYTTCVCTGCEETKQDEVAMLMAVSVFVLHAPPEVVLAPNLRYPCINHMTQCAQSSNIQVRIPTNDFLLDIRSLHARLFDFKLGQVRSC